MQSADFWAHCGSCKKPILLDSKYYACEVSTCRKAAYCSIACFDMHVPVMRHKDAWAIEKRAPKTKAPIEGVEMQNRRVVSNLSPASAPDDTIPHDILIVASKLKDYIRVKSGMNTSANTFERLSDIVRLHCDKAIESARNDGRKTVMDRDFSL